MLPPKVPVVVLETVKLPPAATPAPPVVAVPVTLAVAVESVRLVPVKVEGVGRSGCAGGRTRNGESSGGGVNGCGQTCRGKGGVLHQLRRQRAGCGSGSDGDAKICRSRA